MFVNMGPQHPSTHGVLRIVLKLGGEQVVDLDPVLGYLHRGVEKLVRERGLPPHHRLVDPLEYISSLFCEWPAVMAFEKLLDVQVPRRAEYIRVLSTELNRIASHALFMGWFALDLGGLTPILWSFIERDEIVEMLARADRRADALQLHAHRRRQRRPEPRVHEPPRRLDEPRGRARSRRTRAPQRERDLRPPGARPRRRGPRDGAADVHDRPEPARDRRAVRRPARASRTASIPELEFDIPTRTEGDSLARYLLRMDEIKQSLRIIDQCLHQMPDGPIMAKLPRLLRPRPGRAYARSRARAASTRVYAISDGTDQPFRLRIHDPSFIHLQAVGAADARQPRRRHHGDHGVPRSDHGRRRQVSARRRAADAALPLRCVAHAPEVRSLAARRRLRLDASPRRKAASMTVIARAGPADAPGKIVFTVVPLLLVADDRARAVIVILGADPRHPGDNLPIVRFVVAATAVLLMTHPDRLRDHLHGDEGHRPDEPSDRAGPGRAVRARSLSVVHGLKVLMKEDFTPTGADRRCSPGAGRRLPRQRHVAAGDPVRAGPVRPGLQHRPALLLRRRRPVAWSGLMMAGWSSFNKYSLLGGLRSAAQVVSYEIPLTLSVVGLIMLAGTMSLNRSSLNQSGWFIDWYIFRQPLGFLIFFIAATAEANRTPFDLTEAD